MVSYNHNARERDDKMEKELKKWDNWINVQGPLSPEQ